ncbi:MAG: HAMP domain-containing histidine kinase [Acidobacteria bacterium]|nr:HAMP domain-containing histidine kinase [Acidobacteriota bacterium]
MDSSKNQDRFQIELGVLLEPIEEAAKLYKVAVSQIGHHFGADGGAVILRNPVSGALQTLGWGNGGGWDEGTVSAFLDLQRPALQPNEIMAPIVIDGRAAGVVALRRRKGPFEPGAGRRLTRLCRKVAHEAALREERRVNRVIDQIKDKTVRELRPKDLFYQVLHGLRTLTRYDHSSALLIAEEDAARLVLHAEQIAWDKRKSDRIGRKIKVPQELRAHLRRSASIRWVSFAKAKKGGRGPAASGREDAPNETEAVARLLKWGGRGDEPSEGAILWAPLHHEGDLLGVLKIAARRPGALGAAEAGWVERVVRHVASVIHNARRALSMEERIIEAEKKHAMADLARAISHDVKNAIGAILPLAQQAREELQTGSAKPDVLIQDLAQIEQSAQVCQRIFDGMLQLARSETRPSGSAALPKVLDSTIAIIGTRMKRSGVALEMKVPDDLPEVPAGRGSLEQLFLNLLTNAIDSMPAGGRLKVAARVAGNRLEVRIADTGPGIPADQLKRIHEPFYTTKTEGFGLGLAICRSILWEIDGEMTIDSQPGRGTTVTVLLPLAPAQALARPAERGAPAAGGAPPAGGATSAGGAEPSRGAGE